MSSAEADAFRAPKTIDSKVSALLRDMSLAEKIGQMSQVNAGDSYIHDDLAAALRAGRVGSVINEVNVETVNELQRIAVEESQLGIPLLVGRDVIHGFKTVMPIPLAQAASFNPDLIERGAAVAAREAARCGINWTFAPMIDIARDPRWGRIAESLGEDPILTSALGAAMVRGFQGDDLAQPASILACAKHFAGYGAAESGRDYAATNLPENELRNVHLPPFRAAVDAGVVTLMTSFSDIDGVPATANGFLLRDVLRGEWGFGGFVISDWDSIRQLCIHGLTATDKEAAYEAATAGVDMEMHGDAYLRYLEELVGEGRIDLERVDTAVAAILTAKFRLGLFDDPYTNPESFAPFGDQEALAAAKRLALEGVVLLKNENALLPLNPTELTSLAVIGPVADAPRQQLGTWIFDGDPGLSVTPLAAIRDLLGDEVAVRYAPGLATTRSRDTDGFAAAVQAARASDAAIVVLGEEAILSGEAHSRASIDLPGAQAELVAAIHATGTPVIGVVMAGRPLTLGNVADKLDALLFTGHPGCMGGPAIAELLFGIAAPSGKLPATLPAHGGQIPLYYAQKNTGKPPSPETMVLIDDIDPDADQLSTGMSSYHLDTGVRPLFPFGFGLSYTTFLYDNLELGPTNVAPGGFLTISVDLCNTGACSGVEIAQLYVRDRVGSVTRPVRELKAWQRVALEPGERRRVTFTLHSDDLAFYGRHNRLAAEEGDFDVWVGGSSDAELGAQFVLVDAGNK